MDGTIFAAVGAAFTLASAGIFLGISQNQNGNRRVAMVSKSSPQIERGLQTACKLISRFYIQHDLPIRITKATISYQTATVIANIPARVTTKKISSTRQDLEHYLLAHGITITAGSLKLSVSGTMTIIWARPADKEVRLSQVYRQHYASKGNIVAGGVIPIGMAVEGGPFCIDLNKEESPHAMIVGSTGSGKSVAAMAIVIGALHAGWDVYILNPKVEPQEKRLGLWDFEGFKGVTYIRGYEDMVTAMNRLAHTLDMNDRAVLVMADELADIIEVKGKAIASPLGIISQKGREYDVHLVGVTPKTTKSVLLDDMLHANSSTIVIGLRCNTRYLSQYGTGIGGMNLDTLAGNGHAMVRYGSATTEIQIALPDNIEMVRNSGGVAHKTQVGLLPITERWIDSLPTSARASKNDLRSFASNHGEGIGYDKVIQQYELLVQSGQIDPKGEYQAGVKL